MGSKSSNPSVKRTAKKISVDRTAASAPPAKAGSNGSSPSNGETLRNLYASLLRCRCEQEHFRQLSLHNVSVAKYELAIGQEAMTVGATADLLNEDTIACSPRHLAALVTRGIRLAELPALAERGDAHNFGFSRSISLADDPFNFGTGLALSCKLEKKQRVVLAFCGQIAPALNTWHEAMQFAGVHKLPIVYVISSGVQDRQLFASPPAYLEQFSFMARDYGFPGIVVDGQDVVAVRRVAQESIHRARNGSGPTLIECHMDPTRDPLDYMEHYMKKRSTWDDAWRQGVAAQIRGELETASM